MDGGSTAGALAAIVAVVGVIGRFVIHADRYDRAQARRRPQTPHMVPRSPLLAEPRPRRPKPEPEDARPPIVEVPDRLLVRAARIVVNEQHADAQLLERSMPVIEPMARRLMAALEGRGIIGPRDEAGSAPVLVTPQQLPGVFERWGIVEDTS